MLRIARLMEVIFMKTISRREFLKWSVVALGSLKATLNLDIDKLFTVKNDSDSPIIWLQGAGCTGDFISMLNVTNPTTIDNVLLKTVNMAFNNSIMASSGQEAMTSLRNTAKTYNGQFILVIEGAIPTNSRGNYCIIGLDRSTELTIQQAIIKYGPMAKYVVAAGTCASFGGIPGASIDTGVLPLTFALTKPRNAIVNLPGCPVHPTVLIQTLINLITTGLPSLDTQNRPKAYYGSVVHKSCNPLQCWQKSSCKGFTTRNVCTMLKWNENTYCMKAGYACIGCAAEAFPTNPLISKDVP